jgi:hypothetical protein
VAWNQWLAHMSMAAVPPSRTMDVLANHSAVSSLTCSGKHNVPLAKTRTCGYASSLSRKTSERCGIASLQLSMDKRPSRVEELEQEVEQQRSVLVIARGCVTNDLLVPAFSIII